MDLKDLGLSSLKITSLEEFKDYRTAYPDIKISFGDDAIVDFCGLESNDNFYFKRQKGTFKGNYAEGRSVER